MMRRAALLVSLRVAGYHNDQAAFVRLLVEHRISRQAANDAFQIGWRQRQGGMKCGCYKCNIKEDA